jgi:hypothetical protein
MPSAVEFEQAGPQKYDEFRIYLIFEDTTVRLSNSHIDVTVCNAAA